MIQAPWKEERWVGFTFQADRKQTHADITGNEKADDPGAGGSF